MKYRKEDENHDMTFGQGLSNFWVDEREGVAQAVRSRLLLFSGEWFLDTSEGMPWGGFALTPFTIQEGRVLGLKYSEAIQDIAIKTRVINTPGVSFIDNYTSVFDGNSRLFSVSMTVKTIFGEDFILKTSRNQHGELSIGSDIGLPVIG